jgi:hypothetical protein
LQDQPGQNRGLSPNPSGGGSGLHWDELDEDISVEGLLMGIGDRTTQTPLAA